MTKKLKRQYDNAYPSVTQVLDVLRKYGLEFWFKNNTLAFINEESEKGKLIGTQIHEAIQSHIEKNKARVDTEYHEEVMNALKGFMLFKKENPTIKLIRSEMMLTSEKHKYNGTMDCLGKINDNIVVFDWKSGKIRQERTTPDIYDEYIYQVSAYVKAYNEVENQNVNEAYILALAKNKVAYTLKKIEAQEIEESFNEVFLPALKILYYQKRRKNVSA